jgi:hypothetical protein
MTAWFWAGIPLALAIVALAVGVPYWLTHRQLRPYDHSEGRAYLRARDEAPEGALPEEPGQPVAQRFSGTAPTGTGPWV